MGSNPPPREGGGGFCLIWLLMCIFQLTGAQDDYGCPAQDKISPCRCSSRDMEFQIWCSHSELPRVLEGLNAVSRYMSHPVDELILENNNLPSLPGKVFTSLRVLRLMLRNNRLERVSSGWLEGLHDSLLELFLVEPELRSLPIDSLDNLQGLEAITLQSRTMKRLPRFSGLTKLRYLQINSPNLVELSPMNFHDLPNLEQLHVFGSPRLIRLEAGLFRSLPKLSLINITNSGVAWIHPRAFVDLPEVREICLENNNIPDALIVGRAVVDLPALAVIRLDGNRITRVQEEAFVGLSALSRLYLARNLITEIRPGAFQMLSMLRVLDLNHNLITRIHPEFFIQRTGSALEELWIMNNRLSHVNELRAIMEALPRLKLLEASFNHLEEIPFGALRGHPTLERLHLDHNRLSFLQRETFSAMPALRELRLRNNSLTNLLEAPFWNLPGLKGLDLSGNYFRHVEPILLGNLPNLRRLDLSANGIALIEPESFLDTLALEHVNLSGNAISVIHPLTFGHLTNLYELDVGWNRLIEVVPGLPKNIEHLYLPMNRIVTLPTLETQDFALPALRSLDLSANGVERISPGILSELRNLRKLNLGYNSVRIIDDGTFDGLVRLEQLDLRFNRLVSLHGRSLKPLTRLMDLNLRGNRLEVMRADVFAENTQLQRLDLARNNLAQIPHSTFSTTRDLRELYASHNTLAELPGSLHGLTSLEVLDLSFNKLNILSPETLSSLTSLLELKLVRNRIKELREGAFNRLPRLNFIDLENNDLRVIERNAIRNLPELQSIRLGKNRIQMIPTGAFTDLPLLQTAELQENRIQEIAMNAFINIPQLLFLNLSYNLLPSLEHAGLFNLHSLEVLDISNNRLTRISSDSIGALEWLVELKLDNNRICGIHGSPFDNMPRLRVLSMRSNRMSSVSENAFKRLRSNIAVLDIDGNPLSCSCGMIWLRGWLQQSSSEGPRCADGSLFRDMRLSKQDCLRKKYQTPVHPGCETEVFDESLLTSSLYKDGKPPPAWMNKQAPPLKLPQDSDYYADDDYLNYEILNSTTDAPTANSLLDPILSTAQVQTTAPKRVKTTVLPPLKKKKPAAAGIATSPSSSGFTFFGVPLPNLNFNLWGNSGRKSHRKENLTTRPGRSRYRTYSSSAEPEMQRGFVPLPEPQGGFTPIVDPRIKHNDTLRSMNRTGIVTRVFLAKSRNMSNSEPPARQLAAIHNEDIITAKSTNVQSTVSNIPDSTSTEIATTISQQPASSESYRSEELDVDSEETVVLEGKVASKIVWTTPGITTFVNNITSTTEGNYQARNKNVFWEREEADAALSKPAGTSPMSIDNDDDDDDDDGGDDVESSEPVIFVTTESSDDPLEVLSDENITKQTVHTSRVLEASALSALLIPGGQVPASIPVMVIRPSGRSTIEKVASPHLKLNQTSEIIETSSSSSTTENVKIINENDPFNWYFQNYNESNLEPYVGVVHTGCGTLFVPHFTIVFIFQIYFVFI